MSTFYAQYPPSSGSVNASVGVNNAPIPTSSTEIGAKDPSGNLQPLQVNSSKELLVSIASTVTNPLPVTDAAAEASLASINSHVIKANTDSVTIVSSVLPTGAATETTLNAINTKTPALGQALSAASVPVVLASDQSTVPVSIASVPLPTGAATAANQTNGSQKTQIVDGLGNVIASTSNALNVDVVNFPATQAVTQSTSPWVVDGSAHTQPISAVSLPLPTGAATESTLSTLNGKVIAVNTGNVTVVSSALPTGAATAAKQPALGTAGTASTDVITIQGISSMTPVSVSGTVSASPVAYTKSNAPTYNAYTSTAVTTSAYVQLVASLTSAVKQLQIFDSSGQAMIIATGGSGSEVDQIYVPPGGGVFDLSILASTRVSIKALTATASSGYLLINYLG